MTHLRERSIDTSKLNSDGAQKKATKGAEETPAKKKNLKADK